ncbi:MAG: hypothetical protein ACTSU3_11455 [Candidatus Thorarchaeota archaeon]
MLLPFVPTTGQMESDTKIVAIIDDEPMLPAATSEFSVFSQWSSLYSAASYTNLRAIVRRLSEDYNQRVWYHLDKAPSEPLEAAWAYANATLRSYTSNNLSFHLLTEQLNLVAVKNGTNPNAAPIIISGRISSRWAPGANSFGASVAAVLETARILDPYSLANDVYFVLMNTNSGGYSQRGEGSVGMEALLELLIEQNRKPAAMFCYTYLLYKYNYEDYGDMISLRYKSTSDTSSQFSFINSIATRSSNSGGQGRIALYSVGNDDHSWDHSGSYEADFYGIPSYTVSQYYGDSVSGSQYDDYDYWRYDYSQAEEAVGAVASITATLGVLGTGSAPAFHYAATMNANTTRSTSLAVSGYSYLNVSLSWSGNTSILAEIKSPTGYVYYSRSGDNKSLELRYLVQSLDSYTLHLANTGNESVLVSYSYRQWHDYDQDGLHDLAEFMYGTDSLSKDTDQDMLDDPVELSLGTDPVVRDTDNDTIIDGIEIAIGSNPLSVDSDGDNVPDSQEYAMGMNLSADDSDLDGLTDAFEIANGMNPISNDSDSDGLLDFYEIQLNTDPMSADSDSDGVPDLFEVINGLNPLNADSDGDGLSDLYEIENNLLPNNPDSDSDGILDSLDFAPMEHWYNVIPSIGLAAFGVILTIWLLFKRHSYNKAGG